MSAPPHFDDAARLPCLTTGTPAPATTKEAIVEMFTVWWPSPPVPTMSTVPGMSEKSTDVANSRIAPAAAASSAAEMPLTRMPKANAAMRAGEASPAMISRTAQVTWDSLSSSRRPMRSRTPGHVKYDDGSCPSSRAEVTSAAVERAGPRPPATSGPVAAFGPVAAVSGEGMSLEGGVGTVFRLSAGEFCSGPAPDARARGVPVWSARQRAWRACGGCRTRYVAAVRCEVRPA